MKKLSSSQIIVFGFILFIFIGSILLTFPIATADGEGASFKDALFTATSAMCVTGLVVKDTATYWSLFGKTVIILLIQIGGMGVVTAATALFLLSGKKLGLRERNLMQYSISALQVGGIISHVKFIIKVSVAIELIGAFFLAFVFIPDRGIMDGSFYAIFHSISAFCNAGFDLMGDREIFSSLTHLSKNIFFNVVIMALIITGGIGFATWDDIKKHKFNIKKYHLQSKVIIATSLLLTIIPALYFLFFEFPMLGLFERILPSLFQSVTCRTAGFNTVDFSVLTETGIFVMILLMIVGGSPGSTAGGMKTTTLAILIATSISVFKREKQPHFFGRRIPEESIKNSAALLILYITLALFGAFLISRIEQLPILSCLFETTSAVGTVGLSLGNTPKLTRESCAVLIFLMFVGRVGGLTLIFSTVNASEALGRLPEEKITVG